MKRLVKKKLYHNAGERIYEGGELAPVVVTSTRPSRIRKEEVFEGPSLKPVIVRSTKRSKVSGNIRRGDIQSYPDVQKKFTNPVVNKETITTGTGKRNRMDFKEFMLHKFKNDLSPEMMGAWNNYYGDKVLNAAQGVTAITEKIPVPAVSGPSKLINVGLGAIDLIDDLRKGDYTNIVLDVAGLLPDVNIPGVPGMMYQGARWAGTGADLTENYGQKKPVRPSELQSGGPTAGKAKEMLRDFGWIAGGMKQTPAMRQNSKRIVDISNVGEKNKTDNTYVKPLVVAPGPEELKKMADKRKAAEATKQAILNQRKTNIKTKGSITKGNFTTDKYRAFPNSVWPEPGAMFDEAINPFYQIGSMAAGLGNSLYELNRTGNPVPVFNQLGMTAIAGNMGFDPAGFTGKAISAAEGVAGKIPDLMPNVSRFNPWRFKPNPEAYYRGIGKSGLDDALQTGVLRSPEGSGWGDRVHTTSQLDVAKAYSRNYRPIDYVPDGSGGYTIEEGPPPKGFSDKSFIAEIPRTELINPNSPEPWSLSGPKKTFHQFINDKPIPTNNVKFLKEHWLKGYKEVPGTRQRAGITPTGNVVDQPPAGQLPEGPQMDPNIVEPGEIPPNMGDIIKNLEKIQQQRANAPKIPWKKPDFVPRFTDRGGKVMFEADPELYGNFITQDLWNKASSDVVWKVNKYLDDPLFKPPVPGRSADIAVEAISGYQPPTDEFSDMLRSDAAMKAISHELSTRYAIGKSSVNELGLQGSKAPIEGLPETSGDRMALTNPAKRYNAFNKYGYHYLDNEALYKSFLKSIDENTLRAKQFQKSLPMNQSGGLTKRLVPKIKQVAGPAGYILPEKKSMLQELREWEDSQKTKEVYQSKIQNNYAEYLKKHPNTSYGPGVPEGMNCMYGVCTVLEGIGAKDFSKTYTGNAAFSDVEESEGYYKVDPTRDGFQIGDIVQYARTKGNPLSRFEGNVTPVNEDDLYPNHAEVILDKYDKEGKTYYKVGHNRGYEQFITQDLSEKELMSRTKGYHTYDGMIVNRYDPKTVEQMKAGEAKRRAILEGQNAYAPMYDKPVDIKGSSTGESFDKDFKPAGVKTTAYETYDNRAKVLNIFEKNYDKIGKMADLSPDVLNKLMQAEIGIFGQESNYGSDTGTTKNLIPDFALPTSRKLRASLSTPDDWVTDYWKNNANNVQQQYKTKEEFVKHLNTDNKYDKDTAEYIYYNQPRSKGGFQQKELSPRGRFMKLDLNNPEHQPLASLALAIDNYHILQEKYPNMKPEQLVDLTILMHNAPNKALTPEYVNYYLPRNDIDYVNKVKKAMGNVVVTPQAPRRPSSDTSTMTAQEKTVITNYLKKLEKKQGS